MSERSDVLNSIAETIADYRQDDLETPTSEHVDRWVTQFDAAVQLPILREMDHVLKKTYFSRDRKEFVSRDAILKRNSSSVTGIRARFFERHRISRHPGWWGEPQSSPYSDKVLEKECGFTVADCGDDPHAYVYLRRCDLYLTSPVNAKDLEAWIAGGSLSRGTDSTLISSR